MPHSIVTDVCEGVADCVEACPVDCIKPGPGKNAKGTDWYMIEFATCIDCGICLQVCPVKGAVIAEENIELQLTPGYEEKFKGKGKGNKKGKGLFGMF